MCVDDLLFLLNFIILPFMPSTYVRFEGQYCSEAASYLQSPADDKVFVAARDHFKSTFELGKCIQEILRDPMISIAHGHAIQELAIVKSLAIRWHFEQNTRLRDIASDICHIKARPSAEKWNEKFWTIRRPQARTDAPTFMAFGMDNLPTSLHPDLIILDDIEVRENTSNPEQVAKLELAVKQLSPLLPPFAKKILSGTPWVFDGPIHKAMQDASRSPFIRPIMYQGKPLCPQRYDMDAIAKKQKEVGPAIWAAQYLLDPLPAESQVFFPEYFDNTRGPVPPGMETLHFLYVDVSSLDRHGDPGEAGLADVRWAANGKRYVTEAFAGRYGQVDTIKKVFEIHERGWSGVRSDPKPNALTELVVEINAPLVTKGIIDNEQERRYGQVEFNTFEIRASESKLGTYGRIAALQRPYANGGIVHAEGMAGGRLEKELLQFPKHPSPQVSDAMAMSEKRGWSPNVAIDPDQGLDPRTRRLKELIEGGDIDAFSGFGDDDRGGRRNL
jgi:hypothetical protein